jgi:hypothetical protein
MAKSVSESSLSALRPGKLKKPKQKPKGSPIKRLKIIDNVELLSVTSMAEIVSGSRLISNQNASFKPDKIKSKNSSFFTLI